MISLDKGTRVYYIHRMRKQTFSHTLDPVLVKTVDKVVEDNEELFNSRSHFIELAIIAYLNDIPNKEFNVSTHSGVTAYEALDALRSLSAFLEASTLAKRIGILSRIAQLNNPLQHALNVIAKAEGREVPETDGTWTS